MSLVGTVSRMHRLSPGGPPPMNPAPRHRSTRDRPAKAPLSEDAVVDAALAILKADGLEAVTMRRVAAALDTGAASLYVYVSGREGLMQAMLDRVIAAVEFESPASSRWPAASTPRTRPGRATSSCCWRPPPPVRTTCGGPTPASRPTRSTRGSPA